MLLSELKENQSAVIASGPEKTVFDRRLCDMGFRRGERVVCIKRGFFKSPIIYSVCGSFIALRKSDAEIIEVVL